jgi:phage shock protein A
MSIFDRMDRVVSSNFNSLLDAAEDPKKSLEQTLRDMQQQLRAAKSELVRSVAAERQLKNKTDELQKDEARWEERARLAVEKGDDELARAALLQRRRIKQEHGKTEQLRAEQRGNALEMRDAWSEMQRKFKDFSARKNTIAARAQQAKAGGGVEALGGDPSAFEAFSNLEDRIEGVDDVFQAQREVDDMLGKQGSPTGMSRAEVEARFRELEGSSTGGEGGGEGLDAELQELKQRVRVKVE